MAASNLPQPLANELLGRPNIVRVATRNADGTTHMFAAWFAWDGERVLIATTDNSRKVRNLRRDPRVSLLIDESDGGLVNRGLLLYGSVTFLEAGEDADRVTRDICSRYMDGGAVGSDAFDDYIRAISPLVILEIAIDKSSHWDTNNVEASERAQREAGAPLRLADRGSGRA